MANQYETLAEEMAKRYGLDPRIFKRLVNAESRGNPNAVSPKGARGLGQLMPGTARDLGVDPTDPIQNLEGSARYLKMQKDKFQDYPRALAAYNAGPGAVEKHGGIPPFKETQNYVKTILNGLGPSEAQAAEIDWDAELTNYKAQQQAPQGEQPGIDWDAELTNYKAQPQQPMQQPTVQPTVQPGTPVQSDDFKAQYEANPEAIEQSRDKRVNLVSSKTGQQVTVTVGEAIDGLKANQQGSMVRKPMPSPSTPPPEEVMAQLPDWAKNNPQVFEALKSAWGVMEPVVDAGAMTAGGIAGGVAGAPLGPVGAAAGGVGGAGLGYSLAQQGKGLAAQALGLQQTPPLAEGLQKSATDTLKGAEMEILGQGAGKVLSTGINAVKGGIRGAGQMLVKPRVNPVEGKSAPEVLRAFEELGVKAPLGAVTGNRAAQYAEQAANALPGSSSVMTRNTDKIRQGYSDAVDDIATQFSPNVMTSPEAAGDAAIQMAKGAKEKFVKNAGRVFDSLGERIGNAPASLANVKDWVDKATSEISDPILQSKLEGSIKKEFGGVYDDIVMPDGSTAPRPLTFYDLKHLRTRIGERLENPLIADTDTVGRGVLKKTYEALSRDMEASANTAGQGELFKKVNTWYNAQKDTHGTLEKLVGSGEAKAVGSKLLSPSISSKTVNAMRRKFTTDEWDTLAGTMFNNMARAKPGAQSVVGSELSPETFLTNWDKMRDVRNSIWGGTRYAEVAKDIDKLATVSEALKKSALMRNYSNTAGVSWWMNFIKAMSPAAITGAAITGNVGVGLGMVGAGYSANRFAKLITNPDFVRWAANSGQMSLKRELPETLKHQMIRRLLTVSKKNPDITEDVNGFIEDFTTGFLDPYPQGTLNE